MRHIATTFSADCGRLLRALGINGDNVTRVTIDLLPGSVITVTTEQAMTEEQLAALAVGIETESGFDKPIKKLTTDGEFS